MFCESFYGEVAPLRIPIDTHREMLFCIVLNCNPEQSEGSLKHKVTTKLTLTVIPDLFRNHRKRQKIIIF